MRQRLRSGLEFVIQQIISFGKISGYRNVDKHDTRQYNAYSLQFSHWSDMSYEKSNGKKRNYGNMDVVLSLTLDF